MGFLGSAWNGVKAAGKNFVGERADGSTFSDRIQTANALLNDDPATAAKLRAGVQSRATEAARARALESLAHQTGMTPEQRMAMALNPEKYGEALAGRSAYHSEAGGQTIFNGPGGVPQGYVTPKLVEHQGQYGRQTETGYVPTGAAPESLSERITRENNEAMRAAENRRAVETERHNRASEGFDGQRIARMGAGGGGGGDSTPSMGGGSNFAADLAAARAELNRRRGGR